MQKWLTTFFSAKGTQKLHKSLTKNAQMFCRFLWVGQTRNRFLSTNLSKRIPCLSCWQCLDALGIIPLHSVYLNVSGAPTQYFKGCRRLCSVKNDQFVTAMVVRYRVTLHAQFHMIAVVICNLHEYIYSCTYLMDVLNRCQI